MNISEQSWKVVMMLASLLEVSYGIYSGWKRKNWGSSNSFQWVWGCVSDDDGDPAMTDPMGAIAEAVGAIIGLYIVYRLFRLLYRRFKQWLHRSSRNFGCCSLRRMVEMPDKLNRFCCLYLSGLKQPRTLLWRRSRRKTWALKFYCTFK